MPRVVRKSVAETTKDSFHSSFHHNDKYVACVRVIMRNILRIDVIEGTKSVAENFQNAAWLNGIMQV